MNKDQIMRAVENASPEQLEQIAAIVGTGLVQVSVTGRHVGCVVLSDESADLGDVLLQPEANGMPPLGQAYYLENVHFPNPYRVPITHRWSGGECPVERSQLVLVEYSDGFERIGPGESFPWEDAGIIVGFTPLDVIGVEDES